MRDSGASGLWSIIGYAAIETANGAYLGHGGHVLCSLDEVHWFGIWLHCAAPLGSGCGPGTSERR
jgi:hypothetical protein